MAQDPAPSDDGIDEGVPGQPAGAHTEPDQTMAMGVANIGFLLERLGEDCDDLQYLRELTKNALEADATLIAWDVDWLLHDAGGILKLCCIDNGRGMAAREMVQHINNLSSSGRVQAMDANFGVGAKISAATRNPAGVIYQSWRDGQGAMIQLWRDPGSGEYGLKQFRLPDGSYAYVVPLGSTARPEQIEEPRYEGHAAGHRRHPRHRRGPRGGADAIALVRPLPQRALLRVPGACDGARSRGVAVRRHPTRTAACCGVCGGWPTSSPSTPIIAAS